MSISSLTIKPMPQYASMTVLPKVRFGTLAPESPIKAPAGPSQSSWLRQHGVKLMVFLPIIVGSALGLWHNQSEQVDRAKVQISALPTNCQDLQPKAMLPVIKSLRYIFFPRSLLADLAEKLATCK
jgi:hypothetical protein